MNNLEKLEVLNHLIKSEESRTISDDLIFEQSYMTPLDSENKLDDSLLIICENLDLLGIDIESVKIETKENDFTFEIDFQKFSIKYSNRYKMYECLGYLPETSGLFYLCELDSFRKKKSKFKRALLDAIETVKYIWLENKA